MKKGQKIYDTRDIFKSGEYLRFPKINMDDQTIIDRSAVTLSITSILRDLPPRYRPEYNNDLIKIRRNIREIRESPEETLERLKQEENRSNFKAYTKIHERGSDVVIIFRTVDFVYLTINNENYVQESKKQLFT